LIPPPVLVGPLVVVPVPVCTGAAGVEEGDESSKHPELEDEPTVIKADEPPFPYGPLLKAARMNEVPEAILVFQTISSVVRLLIYTYPLKWPLQWRRIQRFVLGE